MRTQISTKTLKAAFLAAMVKTFGNITQSAKIVGITRETPYKWEKTDENFKNEFRSKEYNEIFMDAIEAKLLKVGLIDENPTVLIFLAKTKCKSRGYIEKAEIEVKTDLEPKIKILFPSSEEYRNSLQNAD